MVILAGSGSSPSSVLAGAAAGVDALGITADLGAGEAADEGGKDLVSNFGETGTGAAAGKGGVDGRGIGSAGLAGASSSAAVAASSVASSSILLIKSYLHQAPDSMPSWQGL